MGIEWLSPAVLGGLVLVAVPIVIHLFARTPVTRVVVPSVRVIAQTTPRLRRRRRLLDPWLLAVRIVTVVAAVLASAGPLLVNRSREAGWARRTVRAIVVDGAVGAVEASPAIADERAGALDAEVIVAEPVDGGLARAVGWLSRQPPAQREVVVIGDAASTPGAAATAAIPADIGLRLRRVATGARGDQGRVWLGATATGDGERAVRLAETREANGASVFATEPEAMPQLPVIATAATPADSALIAAVWEGVVAEGVFLRRRDTWQALENRVGRRPGANRRLAVGADARRPPRGVAARAGAGRRGDRGWAGEPVVEPCARCRRCTASGSDRRAREQGRGGPAGSTAAAGGGGRRGRGTRGTAATARDSRCRAGRLRSPGRRHVERGDPERDRQGRPLAVACRRRRADRRTDGATPP